MSLEEQVIEDVTVDVEKRSLDDAIIEESVVEEVELSDEEIIRMGYETSYPEDFVDDTITINQFYLGEMKVEPNKAKKDGGTFHSSKCVLQCYNDELELRIPFFIENFSDYNQETDTLVVQGKNVLARLVGKLKGESNPSNRFVLNYSIIREVINGTSDVPITIKEVVKRGGYTDYTIV